MTNKKDIGKWLYFEWLIIVRHYWSISEKKIFAFEVLFPTVTSMICTGIYYYMNKMTIALDKMAGLLPTAVSMLIGFSIMQISLLLAADNGIMKKIKEKKLEGKVINNSEVSLYQGLLIQFSHNILNEVLLLLSVFLYLFLKGIFVNKLIKFILLFIQTELVLSVLFSIVRGTTNLYCTFLKH